MARFDFVAVYMMANRRYGAIYTGSTSDLPTRVWQHANGEGSAFTKKYGCGTLVWYEPYEELRFAQDRERRLKNWPRQWKINQIAERHPDWPTCPGSCSRPPPTKTPAGPLSLP